MARSAHHGSAMHKFDLLVTSGAGPTEARRAETAAARRSGHYRLVRGRPIRTYLLDEDGALVDATADPAVHRSTS